MTHTRSRLVCKGIVGIAAVTSLAVLVGCKRNRPVTIRLAGDAWFLNALTRTGKIAEFEKKTGIQVDVIHIHDEAIVTELDKDPASDHGPYDLIVLRHRFLGELVERGRVQPIESFLADPSVHFQSFDPRQQLFPNLWREISWYNNRAYGYPFTVLTTYLCYRKDLLDNPKEKALFKVRYHRDLVPPKTWQEYTQVAEFFTRPKENLYGTYIQGESHIALWYEWLNFSYSFGGNILDTRHGWQYGNVVVNSPQNVAATRQYLKLIAFSPPQTLSYNWNDALDALQQGRAEMGLLWSDQIPLLEDPSHSKVAGKIGYSLIPSAIGKPFSQLEGLSYLIPSFSAHPRAAYRFMEWALSPDVQIAQTLDGSLSPVKATYHDARVRALPYGSAFLEGVPVAIPKPTIPQSPQIVEEMERGLRAIVTRKCSPQQGLDAMAVEIQKILGAKARLRYPVKTRGCPN
ncbi:MAG: ABC transporter substrate-binding protein [Terriglobia bacterium]